MYGQFCVLDMYVSLCNYISPRVCAYVYVCARVWVCDFACVCMSDIFIKLIVSRNDMASLYNF